MVIKGIRKTNNRNGRATCRCPRSDLVMTRVSDKVFLDFSTGESFAFQWKAIAEVISHSVDMGNLADAGISATQFVALTQSIARNSVNTDGEYDD